MSLLATGAAGAFLLVGAGGVARPAEDPDVLVARTTSFAAPPTVRCFLGRPFARTALQHPANYERRRNPAARALRAYLRTRFGRTEPQRRWFVTTSSRRRIELMAIRRGKYHSAVFVKRKVGWVAYTNALGQCTPRQTRYGETAAGWGWDPAGGRPAASATRIRVLVDEMYCTSGRSAKGRIRRPLVYYGKRSVNAAFFIRPLKGNGVETCQGVPPTPAIVVLREPLGNRVLRDGGAVKPTPVQAIEPLFP